MFVVNCLLFHITPAEYALKVWKLTCLITFTILFQASILKLTSHGILHYLWSADLSKKIFSTDCVNIYFPKSIVNSQCLFSIDFEAWSDPNWLYCDSLTLRDLSKDRRVTGGGRWGRSPLPFLKLRKRPNFAKKIP